MRIRIRNTVGTTPTPTPTPPAPSHPPGISSADVSREKLFEKWTQKEQKESLRKQEER
jgi:hypothetical protein